MLTTRRGSDLKIHIRLALASLGRNDTVKGKSVAKLETMLADLRREQIDRGIIRKGGAQ